MAEITIDKKIFLIPDAGSPCDAWRVYFEKLQNAVGKENAKVLWLTTWSKNGSLSCTTNAEFNHFLKKNDIDVSTAATRAIADVSAIGGNILGMGKNITKILSIAMPVLMAGIVTAVILVLIKTSKKVDVVDIAMLATGGVGKLALSAKQASK